MASFISTLGSMLQNGLGNQASNRLQSTLSNQSGGMLGSLGGMLGGRQQGGSQAGDLKNMVGGLLGNLANNPAAAGGLGALAGLLTGGSGSSSTNRAIGGGALAMLASVAYSALKKTGNAPAQSEQSFISKEKLKAEEIEHEAQIFLKAMINAAKCDGTIDQIEMQKILGKAGEEGLTNEEKDFILKESMGPVDMAGLVASSENRPEMAAQIYAASLLAIEIDTPEEKNYLAQLATGLNLNRETVRHIHETMGV